MFWVEGEGRLSSLIRLRDDILRRDYRVLYLAWLKAISMNTVTEAESESPVPPGLRSLSSASRNFADLFEIDKHLLTVASKVSGEQNQVLEPDLRQAIAHLTREECEDYLLRLARGEPHLAIALSARLRQAEPSTHFLSSTRRTVKQLLTDAERAHEEENRWRPQEAASTSQSDSF